MQKRGRIQTSDDLPAMRNDITHLDLYTGLAGFSIAFHAAGFRTVAFCETEPRCQRFLTKAWPGVPINPDARKLDGRKYRGVDVITAGVPCQPASRAGLQRGASDDRWLWGETLRIVDEARPLVCVFENPLGIEDVAEFGIQLAMDGEGRAIGSVGDVVHRTGRIYLNTFLETLESFGYEVGPIFDIPACGVGTPHLRHRLWMVCWLAAVSEPGRKRPDAERGQDGRGPKCVESELADGGGNHGWQDEPGQRPTRRDVDGRDCAADVADAAQRGQRADGSAPGNAGHPDERGESGVAEPEQVRRDAGKSGDGGGQAGARGAHGHELDRCAAGDMAHEPGARCDGEARGWEHVQRQPLSTARSGNCDGNLGDAEQIGGQRRAIIETTHGPCGGSQRSTVCSREQWEHFVWLPCADGKVRRAPDDTIGVVDGLHRSLLAALGNSIVPQVAYEIAKAIRQTIEVCYRNDARETRQGTRKGKT